MAQYEAKRKNFLQSDLGEARQFPKTKEIRTSTNPFELPVPWLLLSEIAQSPTPWRNFWKS